MKLLYAAQSDLAACNAEAIHVIEMVNNLARLGVHITLIAPGEPRKEELVEGVKHITIKKKQGSSGWHYLGQQWDLFWAVQRELSKYPADLVYLRMSASMIMVPWAVFWAKLPLIVEVNGVLEEEIYLSHRVHGSFWRHYVNSLERLVYRGSTKIISVTPEIKNILVEHYDLPFERVAVIPNGVNTNLFHPLDKIVARKKLKLPEDAFIVAFVGNLAPWQGVDTALHAVAKLGDIISNLRFVIVGDGVERQNLLASAAELGISDRVQFVGSRPQTEIPQYLAASDLLLLLLKSHRNQRSGLSPLKMYEYLAMERPILASALPGLDIVKKIGAGENIPADDPHRAAEAIWELYQHPAELNAMGQRGRQYVLKHNDWRELAKEVFKIFQSL